MCLPKAEDGAIWGRKIRYMYCKNLSMTSGMGICGQKKYQNREKSLPIMMINNSMGRKLKILSDEKEIVWAEMRK